MFDIGVNAFNRAVVRGLQDHTGPEHALAPAAGNLRNERYPPIDLNAAGRIRRGWKTGNSANQPDSFPRGGGCSKVGVKRKIYGSSGPF